MDATRDGMQQTAPADGGHTSAPLASPPAHVGGGEGPTPPSGGWIAGKRVAVTVSVALAITIVGSITLVTLGLEIESPEMIIALVALSGIAFVAGAWAAMRLRPRLTWADLGLRPTTPGWLAASAALGAATLALNLGTAAAYSALTGDETIPPDRLAMVDAMQGPAWQVVLMVIAGALFVPFAEELAFRGVVFGWLRRWPLPVAVIVSAVIFGLAHGVSIVLPVAVVLGVVTALVYHRSGSLWTAIVVHAVNNGIAFGLTYVMP